jgi:hypothetical protein
MIHRRGDDQEVPDAEVRGALSSRRLDRGQQTVPEHAVHRFDAEYVSGETLAMIVRLASAHGRPIERVADFGGGNGSTLDRLLESVSRRTRDELRNIGPYAILECGSGRQDAFSGVLPGRCE